MRKTYINKDFHNNVDVKSIGEVAAESLPVLHGVGGGVKLIGWTTNGCCGDTPWRFGTFRGFELINRWAKEIKVIITSFAKQNSQCNNAMQHSFQHLDYFFNIYV